MLDDRYSIAYISHEMEKVSNDSMKIVSLASRRINNLSHYGKIHTSRMTSTIYSWNENSSRRKDPRGTRRNRGNGVTSGSHKGIDTHRRGLEYCRGLSRIKSIIIRSGYRISPLYGKIYPSSKTKDIPLGSREDPFFWWCDGMRKVQSGPNGGRENSEVRSESHRSDLPSDI